MSGGSGVGVRLPRRLYFSRRRRRSLGAISRRFRRLESGVKLFENSAVDAEIPVDSDAAPLWREREQSVDVAQLATGFGSSFQTFIKRHSGWIG